MATRKIPGIAERFFDWKWVGLLAPLFFASSLGMAVGATPDNYPIMFLGAYAFLFLCSCMVVGHCWFGTHLTALRKKSRINNKNKENNLKKYKKSTYCVIAIIILPSLCALSLLGFYHRYMLINDYNGTLTPDTEPFHGECRGAADGQVVILLNTVGYKMGYFPTTLLALRKKPIMTINKKENGDLLLSVDFYSRDGEIVAEISENKFTVNKNNVFKMTRADFHSLKVVDKYNKTVVDAHFSNRQMMKMSINLFVPGYGEVSALSNLRDFCLDVSNSPGLSILNIQ